MLVIISTDQVTVKSVLLNKYEVIIYFNYKFLKMILKYRKEFV